MVFLFFLSLAALLLVEAVCLPFDACLGGTGLRFTFLLFVAIIVFLKTKKKNSILNHTSRLLLSEENPRE